MTSSAVLPRQQASGRAEPRRGSARVPARHAPELAGLTLDELRGYRQELLTEESRVSYWRRLLHARLDLAARTDGGAGDAGARPDDRSLQRVRGLLSQHQSASRRLARTTVEHRHDPPVLPDLAALWESEPATAADEAMLARLAAAETQLSAYRRALHERLDAATGELIMRYRAEPSLALRALPARGQVADRRPVVAPAAAPQRA